MQYSVWLWLLFKSASYLKKKKNLNAYILSEFNLVINILQVVFVSRLFGKIDVHLLIAS